MPIPARPAWCKDCDGLCIAEDIAPLRAIEAAYGAARSGRKVEYPVETCFTNDPLEAAAAVAPYVHWRMGRRHAARALCCGGTRFQFMDVAQPLLKHAECEFGFVEPVIYIGSYIPRLLGVDEPANLRLYNTEGELIGRLTFCRGPDRTWDVEQGSYEPTVED